MPRRHGSHVGSRLSLAMASLLVAQRDLRGVLGLPGSAVSVVNRPKQRGTAWETTIVQYLRMHGIQAERRALGGANDRGDIAGIPGLVIEAKNAARLDLAGWVDEAEKERVNDNADIAVVWVKRRGKTSAAHGYVVMDGLTLVHLLTSGGYIPLPDLATLDPGDPSPTTE